MITDAIFQSFSGRTPVEDTELTKYSSIGIF